ncbi:AAA family ATPase [Streptomyces sp. NPDC058691]|uniref:AAA family ATPase n=1 Tax=Streptomyces sp. NPDC058691 TaxID=3346601 RepID=UPI00366792E8
MDGIIWLNGTFGAGKTTTSAELARLLPGAHVFDTEHVGFMLRHVLAEPAPVRDFQEWPPWRTLAVESIAQVRRFLGGPLIVPQTVIVEAYWAEIHDGLTRRGLPVRHFVLHTDSAGLARRIEGDTVETGARQWRLDHLAAYEAALPWLHAAGTVVDTTGVPPREVARRIAQAASEHTAEVTAG